MGCLSDAIIRKAERISNNTQQNTFFISSTPKIQVAFHGFILMRQQYRYNTSI